MMLALATVRGRIAGFLGTFAAVALGVTLVASTLLVYVSAAPQVPARFAATPIVVHPPVAESGDGVVTAFRPWSSSAAEDLAVTIAAVPGVDAVVVDRSFYAQAVLDGRPVGDPEGPPAGHGWSSAALGAYRLLAGRAPTGDAEVVVDATLGVAPGAPLTLLTASGPRQMTVVGVADGPGFYVSDESAARLAPGVTALGVRTAAEVSTVEPGIRAAIGTAGVVVSGGARSVLEPEQAAKVRWLGTQLLTAMTALGVFVTIFVVASTFALNTMHRRRELGLLRLIGATPGQLRRMILGEAMLVGVAAATVGGLVSTATAPLLGRFLVRSGLENPDLVVRPRALPIVAAITLGIVVAICGAWSASRRAANARPVEALREAAVEKRPMSRGRWIAAAVALAGAAALAIATAAANAEQRVDNALFAAMAGIVAATAVAPLIVGPLARLATWPVLRSRGAIGLLVRGEALVAARRSAATAAPVVATVGLAVLLTSMVTTMREAYPAGEARELRGVAIALPDGTPGLSEATVAAVGNGSAPLPTRVFVGGTVLETLGVADIAAGDAVLSRSAATALGLAPDGQLSVTFADGGSGTLRVASIVDDRAAVADLATARSTVRVHDPSALTPRVAGARPDSSQLTALGARVVDAQVYAESEYAEDTRLLWLFALVLIGLSVGYTGIAVVNTMAMAAQSRRLEHVVLARSGATTGQVLRTVAAETVLVVAIGALLGLAVTVPPLIGMRAGLAEETGTPVDLHLHWPTIGWVSTACVVLAVTAALAATLNGLRGDRRGRSVGAVGAG